MMVFDYKMEFEGMEFDLELREHEDRTTHDKFRYALSLSIEGTETYYSSCIKRTKRRLSQDERDNLMERTFNELMEEE